MSDKAKRKSNPRRRLLIRLIIGIAIIGAVIAIGIDSFRPKGAQIVFIAPDDNGVNNIWIADLNDPENPRQLTTVTDNPVSYRQSLSYFQIGDNGNLLFWIKNDDSQNLYLFEKNTHETRQLMTCDRTYAGCTLQTHVLSPDGRYIAYEQTLEEPIHHVFTANLMLYDTRTEEHQLIYEHDRYNVFSCSVCPQWIGNGDILSYRTNHGEGDFTFYDVEQREIVAEYTLGTIYFKPFFSNDGDLYLYHDETSASDMPNFAMYVHSTFSSEDSVFTFPPRKSVV